jgi:hypothetical protein
MPSFRSVAPSRASMDRWARAETGRRRVHLRQHSAPGPKLPKWAIGACDLAIHDVGETLARETSSDRPTAFGSTCVMPYAESRKAVQLLPAARRDSGAGRPPPGFVPGQFGEKPAVYPAHAALDDVPAGRAPSPRESDQTPRGAWRSAEGAWDSRSALHSAARSRGAKRRRE